MSDNYWRDVKEAHEARVEREGWVSKQYKTEEDQIEGANWKHGVNSDIDDFHKKQLRKLGLKPIKKNTHSFQVTIDGRKAMYYCGRKEKLVFTDGEKVNLPYYDSLEKYVRKDSQ